MIDSYGEIVQPAPATNEFGSHNKEKTMSSLRDKVRKLTMSADDRLLLKQGFVDSDGDLTTDGTTELLAVIFDDYKDSLVDIAKKLQAEDKAEKKDCK